MGRLRETDSEIAVNREESARSTVSEKVMTAAAGSRLMSGSLLNPINPRTQITVLMMIDSVPETRSAGDSSRFFEREREIP